MDSLDYYKIEELLTDDERAARDRAMRFVQDEVLSEIVPCHRARKLPEHRIPRMSVLGLCAPYLKERGRAGLSYMAYGLRRPRSTPSKRCATNKKLNHELT